jgi:hypothetical protein
MEPLFQFRARKRYAKFRREIDDNERWFHYDVNGDYPPMARIERWAKGGTVYVVAYRFHTAQAKT